MTRSTKASLNTASISCLPAILVISLSIAQAVLAATPRILTATVIRVADGDTLTAEAQHTTKLRVRLLGIDAPEVAHGKNPGQPFGQEATRALDELALGQAVQIQEIPGTPYLFREDKPPDHNRGHLRLRAFRALSGRQRDLGLGGGVAFRRDSSAGDVVDQVAEGGCSGHP